MHFIKKGYALRAMFKGIIGAVMLVTVTAAFFISADLQAQEKPKPKLVQIILDEDHTNPKAVAIAEKLYKESIKDSPIPIEVGEIYADFFPLQQTGSEDVFLIAKVLEPPLGCFAAGCSHMIYKSTDGKRWTPVFSAFFLTGWYDANSRDKTPANLILSSDINNKNLGIWIWGSGQYWIANRKK